MPYVRIEVTREGVTNDEKKRLISGVTELLVDVLGKDPATTHIVIAEVETDNWGVGGEQVTDIRRRSREESK